MTRQTIEQRRAASAWAAVNDAARDKGVFKKYEPLVQGAPVSIRTAGFGQTLAFYHSRPNERREYKLLADQLAAWILRESREAPPDPTKTLDDLMNAIIAQATSTEDYRRMMVEALAYLAWLKRFAAGRKSTRKENGPEETSAS
ncbi:MAG: type III-B CRISPR module-associated protein Cmr5 [Bacteroidota bacterium]